MIYYMIIWLFISIAVLTLLYDLILAIRVFKEERNVILSIYAFFISFWIALIKMIVNNFRKVVLEEE